MIDPNPSDNPDNSGDRLERSLSALRNAPIPDGPSQQLIADTLAALDKAASDSDRTSSGVRPLRRIAQLQHDIENR